jgi:hypothetical protein
MFIRLINTILDFFGRPRIIQVRPAETVELDSYDQGYLEGAANAQAFLDVMQALCKSQLPVTVTCKVVDDEDDGPQELNVHVVEGSVEGLCREGHLMVGDYCLDFHEIVTITLDSVFASEES